MNVHSLRLRVSAWYACLLAVMLLLSSVSAYFGLRQYLYGALRYSVEAHARAIGEKLLCDIGTQGESHVIREDKRELRAGSLRAIYKGDTRGRQRVVSIGATQ